MVQFSIIIGLIFQEASATSTALESIKHPDLSKFLVIAAILFIIVVAAAEAAIGLGIVIALYRNRETIWVDEIDLMKW